MYRKVTAACNATTTKLIPLLSYSVYFLRAKGPITCEANKTFYFCQNRAVNQGDDSVRGGRLGARTLGFIQLREMRGRWTPEAAAKKHRHTSPLIQFDRWEQTWFLSSPCLFVYRALQSSLDELKVFLLHLNVNIFLYSNMIMTWMFQFSHYKVYLK